MSAIRYREIVDSLRQIFEADPRTADAGVYVEKNPSVDVVGVQKAIIIVLDKRKPSDDQPIAAGRRTRWELHIGVWACGFAMEPEEAARIRDELLGEVELVLMANRTIRDKVAGSWLMGGEFVSGTQEQNVFSTAETILVADVTTSNG